MNLLALLLLAGFAASDTDLEARKFRTFYSEARTIYTSKHEIVNIFVPPFSEAKLANATESDIKAWAVRNDLVDKLFFVQGDYKDDGTFENKGLFVLKTATGEATKLLDNGVDFTSRDEERKKVYFAATDGIYLYNAERNTAEKYGSVTDNIISIAQTTTEDVIYALTSDKVLYKVTENGTKKEKVDDVKDAQQIVLDDFDDLYFYDSEKRIFVKENSDPVRQFKDLPKNPNKIKLLRPMYGLGDSVLVILDDKVFDIEVFSEVSEKPIYKPIASATAHSMEGTLMYYFARNKSIHELNVVALWYANNPESSVEEDDKKNHVPKSATRLRNALHRAHARKPL